jgi:hypothetical protein
MVATHALGHCAVEMYYHHYPTTDGHLFTINGVGIDETWRAALTPIALCSTWCVWYLARATIRYLRPKTKDKGSSSTAKNRKPESVYPPGMEADLVIENLIKKCKSVSAGPVFWREDSCR